MGKIHCGISRERSNGLVACNQRNAIGLRFQHEGGGGSSGIKHLDRVVGRIIIIDDNIRIQRDNEGIGAAATCEEIVGPRDQPIIPIAAIEEITVCVIPTIENVTVTMSRMNLAARYPMNAISPPASKLGR